MNFESTYGDALVICSGAAKNNLTFSTNLNESLRGVDFVQENAPEHADEVFSGVTKFNPPANAGEAIEAASICLSPCQSPFPSSKFACTTALYLSLAGIIADPTTCRAQSRSVKTPVTSESAITPDVDAAQNEIANPIYDNDLIKEKTTPSRAKAADSWGSVPTKRASVANLAPYLLPYFNNGPAFGLPGTDSRDFRYRTQLSGDWGGLRTDLAHHGFFFDLYSTSAYQDVASGGLKTGSAFIQNTQLSMNVDTGRAGLWPRRRIPHHLRS
jgi:hypothetical protein